MSPTKQCSICKYDLELITENFKQSQYTNKFGTTTIYWSSYCNKCQADKTKEWHQNNKEKCRENEKRYRLNNTDKVKKRKIEYKKKSKNKISEYNRNYRVQHREIRKTQDKQRRQNDIAFRLRKLISRSVSKAISKNGSITKHLSYSIQELKNYLEQQFESWMSWSNHGIYNSKTWNDNDQSTWTWNIDHIIPQSELQYTSMKDENFHKCWALENLRPYSSKQNIIDGASRVRHQ